MRKVLINVVDNSFEIFVIFLFNFLWCRYFFNLGVALLISFLLTTIITLLFLFLKNSKQNKQMLSSKEEKAIIQVKNFLLFSKLYW